MKPIPYFSPFDLLGLSTEETPDLTAIRRARKRIMAEFELADTAEITLRGQSFDKSSLLELFEELEDVGTLELHQQLYQFTPAFDFVTKGNTAFFSPHLTEKTRAWLTNSLEVKDFFTPFFVFRYNQVLLKYFRLNDLDQLNLLCKPLPVDLSYYSQCYKATYQYLQLQVDGLSDLAKQIEAGASPGPEVQEACDEMRINALNLLPDHFDGLRNAYAAALEDVALAVNNAHGRTKLAKIVLRQGLKLETTEAVRFNLQYILDQLMEISPDSEAFWEDLQEATATGLGNKKHRWKWIVGGIVAVKLIVLFFRLI